MQQGPKIYNQQVTSKDALDVLKKLDPKFREEFADGNLTPDEVRKIAIPPKAEKLDLKNAKAVGLEVKEYVTFVVEAYSKGAIAPEEYIEFMKAVTKAAPDTLKPAEAPKTTEAVSRSDQKPVINTQLLQKGVELLASQFGFDPKKFPLTVPNDVQAQLIDQAKRRADPHIDCEIRLRDGLYYPVLIDEKLGAVRARIPNMKNQSELSEFAKTFPKTAELETGLGAGYKILNSGFVIRGDFYVYASNGNPPQGKIFLFTNNKFKEMPDVHHVVPTAGSKQVEVFDVSGRAYNFPDPVKPKSNGMHLVTTRLVELPYK